ncbi:MAG: alpha/beta hydrolase [Desulfobacterales bacterium]|nr:alpha/beta hydrolase [Desulfobacterales bacterium]
MPGETGPASASAYVEIRGLTLHYLEWGAAGDPALICLHGLTGQAGAWETFARGMGRRARVIALDLRGHGESQWAPDGYPMAEYVSDLVAFIDHLGLATVNLAGLSLGGLISMRCAALHPDRIERLVVVDMSPAPGGHVIRRMAEGEEHPESFESLSAAVSWAEGEYLWARGEVLRRDLAGRLRARKDGRWTWKADPGVRKAAGLEEWLNRAESYWESFSRIRCPILAVRGVESDVLNEAVKSRMLQMNPGCEWADIEAAGHNVVGDRPGAFERVAAPFILRQVEASSDLRQRLRCWHRSIYPPK